MKMTAELLMAYMANPKAMDGEVRHTFKIPANKYYTVSAWPEPGIVTVDPERHRDVPSNKISKSDQAA